jgi:hypothetical protein
MVFTVGTQEGEIASKYFGPLLPHIEQVTELDIPDFKKTFKYLLVEDFNTLGLEGGVNSSARTDEELEKVERDLQETQNGFKESFWFFEWKSGGSNKKNGAKGSWGVGKIVFPRASAIKAYLVYTVRRPKAAPDAAESLLFGHAIYNYRTIDEQRFVPDCQWMVKNPERFVTRDGKFNPFPSESILEQDQFIKDWNLARNQQETGTSILIPYCKDAVEVNTLVECIIRDYFINILSGTLECEVRDSDGKRVILTKSNLISEIDKLSDALTTRTNQGGTELKSLCLMYLDKLAGTTIKHEIDFPEDSKNEWKDVLLSDDVQQLLEQAWIAGKVLELSIKAYVPATTDSKKNTLPSESDAFVILLQRSTEPICSTVFCREGILIPNANNSSKLAECISLVLVGQVSGFAGKQNSLANLLKWAEGPAHTTWTSTATKFKNKYKPKSDGEGAIRWVKNSAEAVFDKVKKVQNIYDETSLSDYAPDEDDFGTGIVPPTVKKVVLKCVLNPKNIFRAQLEWDLKNGLNQHTVKVYEISSDKIELFAGTNEAVFPLNNIDLSQRKIYQVEVVENGANFLSNSVILEAKIQPNDYVLVTDHFEGSEINGFSIAPISANKLNIGDKILIKAAYASRATTNWNVEDFILKNLIDRKSLKGLAVEPSQDDGVILKITQPAFNATWTGFHRFREIIVTAVRI